MEVSRLGPIMASVMTSGLNGTIPVFLNAESMFSFVNARTCAFV